MALKRLQQLLGLLQFDRAGSAALNRHVNLMSRAVAMKAISFPVVSTLITIAVATVAATGAAYARTSFDGGWTVQILTQRGACDPNSSFGVEIRDGLVYGSGGLPVRGRVSGKGAVS